MKISYLGMMTYERAYDFEFSSCRQSFPKLFWGQNWLMQLL